MKASIGHALSVFMAFFAIMNPIANTPIFLGLTANDPPKVKRRVAIQALFISFLLILVFALAGKVIFTLFGITLPAFQIMGGSWSP
jgi:multiple antibiotic resistance protein